MCGIAGIYNKKISRINSNLKSMLDIAKHRGPDSQGLYINENFGIGMNRLSIIDLNSGDQPISSIDERYQLVCNGEIYNFHNLKSEMENKGYVFKTKTDVEVILPLFHFYGINGFSKLDGMFSFAIYDSFQNILYICRDRYGIKPLYYYERDDGSFFFSSEIKSILAVNRNLKINENAIVDYLINGFNCSLETVWKGIKSLSPGSCFVLEENSRKEKLFFKDKNVKPYENRSEAKLDLREALIGDINSQLISDVPLGVFLSGGIDSSIILGVITKILDKKTPCFSIDFNEEGFSELDKFTSVAKAYESEQFIYKVNNDLLDHVSDVLSSCDEPFGDMAALPTFLLSQNASKAIKVALSGDGSDEIMYGYSYNSFENRNKKILENEFLHNILRKLPIYSIKQFSLLSRTKSKIDGKPKNIYDMISSKIVKNIDNYRYRTFKSLSDYDLSNYLPNNILYKTDRMTMSSSLEARVPFLGNKTVEVAKKIPWEFQVNKYGQKSLLVDAFDDILPNEKIKKQEKQGFSVPASRWIKERFSIKSFLKNISQTPLEGLVNFNFVSELVRQDYNNEFNHNRFIYRLYIVSEWYKKNS